MVEITDSDASVPPMGEEPSTDNAEPAGQGPEPTDNGAGPSGRMGGLDIQGMLTQLQGMIGKVAHASEPALREVAAKAAELAAVAAEHAGPIAHTLADKTEEVGHAVAGKASGFASSLRSSAHADTPPAGDEPAADVNGEDSPSDGA